MLPRTYLYVPGDDPSKLQKAPGRGADAIIVDLEDGVAPVAKDRSRDLVRDWLDGRGDVSPEIWVRVNNDDRLDGDLDAVESSRLRGVVLPKASPASVDHVARRLDDLIATAGDQAPPPAVFALIETAAGLRDVDAIAAASSVARIGIGEADLGAELGTARDEDLAWAAIRSRVVVASAAAGIDPPVGPTSTDFRDLDALRASTRLLARLGFRGRTAIHPAQLAPINEVFTPSAEEVERARRTVDRFEEMVVSGTGVAVDDDGRMIDEAVVRSARRTLDLAREQA